MLRKELYHFVAQYTHELSFLTVQLYNWLLLCVCIQLDDLYHTGQIDSPDMVKVVYIVCANYTYTGYRIYTWLLDSRKAWAATLRLNGFPESENQKSSLIILLVLFHSACPYKNNFST